MAISIAIPTATAISSRRRTRYVSAGTKSATVSFGSSQQMTNCTATCSLVFSVTPGSVTFAIRLYDDVNGTGHLLSTGQTTTTISANQSNTVNVTFVASVASVSIALGSAAVTAGIPATIPVTVTAKDAAGYTIIGSDPYETPIALSLDAAAAAALSTAAVSAPTSTVALAYNGNTSISSVRISANVPGTSLTAAATLNVQPAASTPPPSAPAPGSVPNHITTYYYYGINGINASIPAAWMAAHADYAEDDGDKVAHATAFKQAGGKYTVSYTDPAYVPYCFAPFSGPSATCRGAIGKDIVDESAWFHLADGTRVRRYVDEHFGYQEALNPASAAVQDAYRKTTQAILANGPIDYFFADDAGSVYLGPDGTQMSGWFWGFNGPAVEITTDAQFIAANRKLLAAAAKPIILNGLTPYTMSPSYNGAWLDSPNVAAQNYESCYADDTGVAGDHSARWVNQSNSLLATFTHRALGVCMLMATPTPANRVYAVASWWMTYNEQYSVIAPYPAQPLPDGFTVVPEFEIVPRRPLTSASSDIAALRSANGAYVREFAACYQAGAPIGPCAAVVNPTSASVTLPRLTGQYTGALAVDDKSMYSGGKATWGGTVPATLPALSALVLR
ncbi:MAG: hypothetical protein M3169_01295 [Candidatus Eremiobacteraeota bacterium]|nr:hypothetical protein [Candidatus Eremiobacteraeota bacterium]